MRYYKQIQDNYIIAIGIGNGSLEITESEYYEILEIVQNKPAVERGFDYRLKTDLSLELFELPLLPDDADAEDYEEALRRFGV